MVGGSETILVVEDEPQINRLVTSTLRRLGYATITALSGEQAIAVADAHAAAVDLLFTDMLLPGMNGGELAAALRQRWPEMKVLYMSGYTDDAIVHRGVLEEGLVFYQKPITPLALLHKVREVLESRASAP